MVSILFGTFFLVAVGLSAGDLPKDIKIDEKGYKKDKKGSVEFAHLKHAEFRACIDCHHNYKDVDLGTSFRNYTYSVFTCKRNSFERKRGLK